MTLFYPKFLTKNIINSASMIADSTGATDEMKRRLYDRNEDIQFVQNSINFSFETITITPPAPISINRIFIQNCNWKAFTIQYNGSTAFSTPIVGSTTDTNHYYEFDAITATTIDIRITDVGTDITPKCGQLYIGTELFTIDDEEAGGYEPIPDWCGAITPVSNKTSFKVFIQDIVNYRLTFKMVASLTNFINLYNRNKTESFVFIPRPVTKADTSDGFTTWAGLANHYQWANAKDILRYTDDLLVNGYDVNIELVQAAGI